MAGPGWKPKYQCHADLVRMLHYGIPILAPTSWARERSQEGKWTRRSSAFCSFEGKVMQVATSWPESGESSIPAFRHRAPVTALAARVVPK